MIKDKACVYLRFAAYFDDETDERLNDQLTACIKKIEDNDLELDKVFVDIGVSGNIILRPKLISLLNHIQNNQIRYLYIPNLSRLSRNYTDHVKICEFLNANGVQLVTLE